jgi:hypothetical protein
MNSAANLLFGKSQKRTQPLPPQETKLASRPYVRAFKNLKQIIALPKSFYLKAIK